MIPFVATHAHAQSAQDRSMLIAWSDSINNTIDITALGKLEGLSRHGSGKSGELRRALYQIHHADFTNDRNEIELALTNLQRLANHMSSPWPSYAMALAFEVLTRKEWVETLSDGKKLAEKHVDAVWRTLRASLDVDHTFLPARRTLGALAAAGGDRFLRPDQIIALERESHLPDADRNALIAWARRMRTVRDYKTALRIFDQAGARGADSGLLNLERARTLFALGDTAGATANYWHGTERITPVAREAYRTDLYWITDAGELASFDSVPDANVNKWLRRFWNARDAEAANAPGERLTEHLRRWVRVYEKYRALSPWTDTFWSRVEMNFDDGQCQHTDGKLFEQLAVPAPTSALDLRHREPIIDHRGMIYLRHGEPTKIMTSGDAAAEPRRRTLSDPYKMLPQATGPTGVRLPWSMRADGEIPVVSIAAENESWLYWWDGESHLLHFRGSDALGRYGPTTLTLSTPFYLLFGTALASALPIPEYYAMARRTAENDSSVFGPNGPRHGYKDNPTCFNEMRAVVTRSAHDVADGVRHDSDTPPNFRGYQSIGLAFGLGSGVDQSGSLLATFAIPAAVLNATHASDNSVQYVIDLRIVAYDKVHDRSFVMDTTRYFTASRELVKGEFLSAFTEWTLPPGTWDIAIRATHHGDVVLLDRHAVHVDNGTGITLSDVVTGRPAAPAWTATDQIPFPINYPNGWYSSQIAELFFEVRGVPADSTFRTTMEVRPLDPKEKGSVKIVGFDRSQGAVNYVRKSLGLTELTPGKYRLVVTVDYGTGKAVREQLITIIPRT